MPKSRLFIILALCFCALIFLVIELPQYLHLDAYKPQILAKLQSQLNREVHYDKSRVSIGWGASFIFEKVTVSEPDHNATFLTADRLRVSVEILPLLHGELILHDLHIDQPKINLVRKADGRFNFSDLLTDRPGQQPLKLSKFSIEKGNIRFVDHTISANGYVTTLANANVSLSTFVRGKKGSIKLKTTILTPSDEGALAITGKYTLAKSGQQLSNTQLDLNVSGQKLNSAHAWPYYRRYVPFAQVLGLFDVESTFSGKLSEFAAKGKINVSGLRFDYKPVFHAVLQPKALKAAYQLNVSQNAVDVKSIDLTVDGLRVRGGCKISGIDSNDPRITAKATTSPIDLAKFNAYIPYGIITKDVADYIEQKIKGGLLRLDDGSLDGRVSQILNMGVGHNYDALTINARIEKGIVSYGPTAPTFNNINGKLTLQGKDFILRDMSGQFGTSPFTLNGKITEYVPTPVPCSYPFSLQISPRHPEVAWLIGTGYGKTLSFSGDSSLSLNGDGSLDHYALNGLWNLTQAGLAITDIIAKPAGKATSITFKSILTRNDLTVTSANIIAAPLQATLSGNWQYSAPQGKASLSLTTNRFPAQDVAPILLKVKKYQPEGTIQATLTATSSDLKNNRLAWYGNININNAGLKLNELLKPLRNATGSITIADQSLALPTLNLTVGTSPCRLKGKFQWGDNFSYALAFASARLLPSDIGLAASTPATTLNDIHGIISSRGDTISIKKLSGQINDSQLTIRGTVVTTPQLRTANISVSAPHLSLDDIIFLSTISQAASPNQKPNATIPLHLTAQVTADSGYLADIEYTKLTSTAEYKDNILYLNPYLFNTYGGKVQGNGRLDFSGPTPRYQFSTNATNINTAKLLPALGFNNQKLAGNLAMTSEIICRGKTAIECKNSVLGSAKITIADGSINRFPILSKVFSILNIAQIFKFQLPDMVSGGMPFDKISGSFAFTDGIISSSNLYMSSNAMNISAIGTYSLPKNEVNATIGVQPLQTIDKVVSRIPIVGWILTGKDKTLITTYFEAKGNVNDPKVSAIPVKSMARGTFDIFKRIFTLPAKLITDTGEVILNN